jgi:hypothetical protein
MRILVPLALVGLAACYSPRTIATDGYPADPFGAGYDEPLHASLWISPHTGLASFDVNRPAHVAIFLWDPGRSFTMVYPQIGRTRAQQFGAGRHQLWTGVRDFQAPMARTAYYQRTAPEAFGLVYFVLIAAERPLAINAFHAGGRSPWLDRVAWSMNPYTATELLASQVVPYPNSTEWTAAYQVAWLHDELPQPRSGDLRWVRCPSGVTIAIPFQLLHNWEFFCPDGAPARPAPGDTADEETRRRVAERAVPPSVRGGDQPSEEEVQELVRRIRREREADGETAGTTVPRLRRAEARAGESATGVPVRPVVPPARPVRATAPDATVSPAPARPTARPRPEVDRPRPHPEPPRPAAERRPEAQRPRPEAQRPRPAPQRPPPDAQRPASRPETAPARPQRPPPDVPL